MNKRTRSIVILVLVVCMMIFQIIPAMALAEGEKQTIIVSKEVCNTNDKSVDVSISLRDNPGIVSMQLTVGYDNNVLKLTKVTDGGKIGTAVHSDNYSSPYTLSWVNDTATTNFTSDGAIVTLTFDIEKGVAGNYPITVSYNSGNYEIYDKDVNEIDFSIQNGSVTIKEELVSVTGVNVEPASKTLKAKGESFTLNADVIPANATNKNVSYTSSNTSVVIVDSLTGVVTAVANGYATITVTTEDGSKTASCKITVDIPHVHEYDTTEWKNDGTKHWHECKSGDGATIDVDEHAGGTATCTEKAICSVCGTSYGDFAAHTYIEKAEENYLKTKATCISKAVYYVSCEVCGEKGTETFEYGELDSDNHIGNTYIKDNVEATCTESGYTGDIYCKDCDEKLDEGSVIPASHKLEKVKAKEATYEEDGNIEYYYCLECGKIFADSEATNEIDLEDTVINKKDKEIPVTEEETENQSESQSETQDSADNNTPQTGDFNKIILWSVVVLFGYFGMLGATILKKKYNR